MASEILLITDEQAKAIQEGFKFGGQSLETARAFGSYVGKILGTVPEDLIGLLGGDWLAIKRAENIVRTARKAQERLAREQVEPEPVSLSVALPLLAAAGEEDRDALVDQWARLLAAAQDPNRASSVRNSFITTLKAFEPLDAAIFARLENLNGPMQPSPRQVFSNLLSVGPDQAEVSLLHLIELGVLRDGYTRVGAPTLEVQSPNLTTYGRELARVLRG